MFHTPAHKQPAALVIERAFNTIPTVQIDTLHNVTYGVYRAGRLIASGNVGTISEAAADLLVARLERQYPGCRVDCSESCEDLDFEFAEEERANRLLGYTN